MRGIILRQVKQRVNKHCIKLKDRVFYRDFVEIKTNNAKPNGHLVPAAWRIGYVRKVSINQLSLSHTITSVNQQRLPDALCAVWRRETPKTGEDGIVRYRTPPHGFLDRGEEALKSGKAP